LIFNTYYLQQIHELASPILLLTGLILLVLILIKFISTSITVFRNRKSLDGDLILPSIIYFFTLSLVVVNPVFLNAEFFQSKVKYRGCYEGTMNTGTILFRESGKFEYRHTGFFGITSFYNGTWAQSGDTLTIDYRSEAPEFVGEKMLLTEDWFVKINPISFSETDSFIFYRGFCRGAN
tara:strand:+ start:5956 stop:6492 length:537 start_codon:yes stop_codon:yes gene_type:complete